MNIENNTIANYVMFKLDKIDNDFTLDELSKIDELVINYLDIQQDNEKFDFNTLKLFDNINNITLKNFYIYDNDILALDDLLSLKTITFEKCDFQNGDLIANLKITNLSLCDCNLNNYEFVYQMLNLTALTIINGNLDMNKINELKKLQYLNIVASNTENSSNLLLPNLEELYIENTNINNIDFIKQLSSLKLISLDDEKYESNKGLLENTEIKVVLYSLGI